VFNPDQSRRGLRGSSKQRQVQDFFLKDVKGNPADKRPMSPLVAATIRISAAQGDSVN
jgi:hypothetical protein